MTLEEPLDIPAIGLDVDGVIANFSGYATKKLGLDPTRWTSWSVSRSYGKEDAARVWALVDDPATFVSVSPLPEAAEAISLLRQANVYPVFITSMPRKFKALRKWWIAEHFGEALRGGPVYLEAVDSAKDKPAKALEYGLTHFVEDKPETANAMARAGLTSILVPTIYSAGDPVDPAVRVQSLLNFATDVLEGVTA